MSFRFWGTVAVIPLGVALAGCTDSFPDVSDDQILNLFATDSMASILGDTDALPTIPRQAEECVRLLAGLDDDALQDMPAEMVDAVKAECQSEFSERLADGERNPMGLNIEHLENAEFAERVTAVRADAQEAAREQAAAAADRREADRAAEQDARRETLIADQQAAIAAAKDRLEEIKTDLPARLEEAAAVCAEFDREKEALRERAGRSPVLNRAWGSNVCRGSYADRAARQLDRIEKTVGEMAVRENSTVIPSMPHLGDADPDKIAAEIESVQQQIAELRDA